MSKEMKVNSWENTIASQCRWSEYGKELIGDWAILWEDSEADYQGHARVLAYKQGKIRYLEWYYGSCSGCDMYEEMKEEDIRKAFETDNMIEFKNIDAFCEWLKMLKSTNDYKFEQFGIAISSAFKNPEIDWIEDPSKLQAKIDVLCLLKE
jgi:hypothetical protein